MSSFLSNLVANERRTATLERVETPGAALTLTRSATLAITTAGTTITWQVETRNRNFVWSGTDITIPTSGYYLLNFFYTANLSHTTFMRLIVNGVITGFFSSSALASSTQGFSVMRYFATADVIRLQALPSVNATIAVNAENVSGESPILHIAQITGAI